MWKFNVYRSRTISVVYSSCMHQLKIWEANKRRRKKKKENNKQLKFCYIFYEVRRARLFVGSFVRLFQTVSKHNHKICDTLSYTSILDVRGQSLISRASDKIETSERAIFARRRAQFQNHILATKYAYVCCAMLSTAHTHRQSQWMWIGCVFWQK